MGEWDVGPSVYARDEETASGGVEDGRCVDLLCG